MPQRSERQRPAPRPRATSGRRRGRSSTSSPAPRPRRTAAVVVVTALAALVILGIVTAGLYASVSRDLPDPTRQLKGTDETTKVYDRKGVLLADLFAEQNRTAVPLRAIPASLRQAVIATEDERFYRHAGVDPLGIARALLVDVSTGTSAQGGSTITQQYVKNAFVTDERSLRRKFAEAILAYRVENTFSKDRILEMYLNTIYFGHGAYGVQAAAQTYFGKPAASLSLAESAMLAGVIKSPARYSPYLDETAAEGRRRVVLDQMLAQGYITQQAHDSAQSSPIRVAGLKPRSAVAPYFMEWVKSDLVARFGEDAVYRGGLKVATSLDLGAQRAAEKAAGVLGRRGDPAVALVAEDPRTGEIRAMVGGGDFGHQQYNIATQGRRQPGSAFKPFVLAAALRSGVSPEALFESGPVELATSSGPWRVTGAGADASGPMRLRVATEKSVNSVFAQLIMKIGPERVARTAEELGITTTVTPVPAIALGGLQEGVSPLEMTSAYATLADGGVRTRPHGILRVTDAAGRTLYAASSAGKRVADADVAYLTTDMLEGVIARGTGVAADIGRPAAGKTGTTQRYRDAWFVGYTPDLAAAVWVGYPDAQRAMDSVHGRRVTGGSFPAEIWASFMKAALAGTPAYGFVRPSGLVTATICLDSGLLATDACPRRGPALFLAGAVPGPCTLHPARPRPSSPPSVTPSAPATASTAATDAAPVARFTHRAGPAGTHRLTFDATASNGHALTYEWRFGDGMTATGVSVRHTYPAPGRYLVRLTVSDGTGRADHASQHVVVE